MATVNAVGNSLTGSTGSGAFVGATAPTLSQVTFSTTSGIIGTTTNDNAAAGSVGQEQENNIVFASTVSLSTGTAADITSLVLTAGDYDVWGNVSFNGGATTLVVYLLGWINTTSATAPDQSLYSTQSYTSTGRVVFDAGISVGFSVPGRRITVANSTTTTIYLSAQGGFSVSTLTCCGALYARRRR